MEEDLPENKHPNLGTDPQEQDLEASSSTPVDSIEEDLLAELGLSPMPSHPTPREATSQQLSSLQMPNSAPDVLNMIDTLGLRPFEFPVLSSAAHQAIHEKLVENLEAIKNITTSPLKQALEYAAYHQNNLVGLYQQHPELKSFHAKRLVQFMNQLDSSLQELVGLLESEDFQHTLLQNTDKLSAAKRHLLYFYNTLQPTLIDYARIQYAPQESKLGYWLRFFGLKRPNKSIKQFAVAQEKINLELHKLTEKLYLIQEVLLYVNQTIFGPENYQYITGEIIYGLYEMDEDIEKIAVSLISVVPLRGITETLIQSYSSIRTDNKLYCLKLIYFMLKHDINFNLVDCDGQSHILDNLIEMLALNSEDDLLQPWLAKINQALETLKDKAHKAHAEFINSIIKEKVAIEDLIHQLTSAQNNLNNQLVTLRHCVVLAFGIIQHLPESYLVDADHKKLIDLVQDFMCLIPIKEHMKLRLELEKLLETNIHRKIYEIPEWARPVKEPKEKLISMSKKEIIFNKKIEQIAHQMMPEPEMKELQWQICQMIRNQSKSLFAKVKLVELKKASWEDQIEKSMKNLTLAEIFPNFHQLIAFEGLISHWVCDCILYEFTDDKRIRESLNQMDAVRAFFRQTTQMALDKGYPQVAYFLAQGLEHPAFDNMKALGHETPFEKARHIPVESLNFNQLPQFSKLTLRLQNLHKICKGSFAFLTLGQIFIKLQSMQNHIKEKIKNESSPKSQIKTFIQKRVNWRIIEDDEVIVNFRDHQLREINYINVSSNVIVTDEQLHELDFESIYRKCQWVIDNKTSLRVVNRLDDKAVHTYQAILKHLKYLIDKYNLLPSVKILLGIFNYLHQMPILASTPMDQDLKGLLKVWLEKTTNLMQEGSLTSPILEAIHTDLKDKATLIPSDMKTEAFEKSIAQLDIIIAQSQNWLAATPEANYSQAYIKVLSSYLEGTQQSQIKLPSQFDESFAHAKTEEVFYHDIEEETNPHEIGFAETWNIFKQISSNTIKGPPFSYENLKDTFFKAFPWAIEKEAQLHSQPIVDNLLHINPTIAKQLQKSVMSLVFISLDTIGKLAGPYGELVLYNLEKIDNIISTLETVAEAIDDPSYLLNDDNARAFDELVQAKCEAIKQQNDLIYNKLKDNQALAPHEKYTANPYMNYLMNINQQELNYHIGISDNQTSILPPSLVISQQQDYSSQSYEAQKEAQNIDEWDALTEEINSLFDDDIFLDQE